MAMTSLEWGAIVADPRFQVLHKKKQAFLAGLMIFSVFFYFLLPIGAAYFPALYSIKVWGPSTSAFSSRCRSSSSPGASPSITPGAPTTSSTRWRGNWSQTSRRK